MSRSLVKNAAHLALAMGAAVAGSARAAAPVQLILCEAIVTPKEYQGDITPVRPNTTFSGAGTDDNVFAVMKFSPFGRSVGFRVQVTLDTPDGRVEQDRVLSVKSTEHNVTTSFPLRDEGRYCMTVVDEFDEAQKYSESQCFTITK